MSKQGSTAVKGKNQLTDIDVLRVSAVVAVLGHRVGLSVREEWERSSPMPHVVQLLMGFCSL